MYIVHVFCDNQKYFCLLGKSTFSFKGISNDFSFLIHFLVNFLFANKTAPAEMLHSAVSHLGIYCLPMSHKKGARLI